MEGTQHTVVVAGAGLAGSLAAVLLGKRGFKVEVVEWRQDSRKDESEWAGRSINLALSARGRAALRKAGIEKQVVEELCIPMYGRVMHDEKGDLSYMPYGVGEQAILSVGRRKLNELLISTAEALPNVRFHFESKITNADLRKTQVHFQEAGSERMVEGDLIVGADGAFSVVRSSMVRKKGFNYSQKYLEHGYKELTIPPRKDGSFALENHNALHIWPRGTFMMIALPNPDRTFTVTLFMPHEQFDALDSKEKVSDFFNAQFPDSVPLMPDLLEEYMKNEVGYLATIRNDPYYWNRAILVGDAAHAVVPFYGQGMNASLEDVNVLDDLIDTVEGDLDKLVRIYSEARMPNGYAVADLSLANYIEMRSKVKSQWFLWRKALEKIVYRIAPTKFVPLYTMVAFTDIHYSDIMAKAKRQDHFLNSLLVVLPTICVATAAFSVPFVRNAVLERFRSMFSK